MRTPEETTFYRQRVTAHIERSAHRNHRDRVVATLTGATDDDIRYWSGKFRSCRRVGMLRVEFTVEEERRRYVR